MTVAGGRLILDDHRICILWRGACFECTATIRRNSMMGLTGIFTLMLVFGSASAAIDADRVTELPGLATADLPTMWSGYINVSIPGTQSIASIHYWLVEAEVFFLAASVQLTVEFVGGRWWRQCDAHCCLAAGWSRRI